MKTTGRVAFALVALGLVLALSSYLFLRGHGFSARAEPRELETFLARAARRIAIPMDVRDLNNPVPASAEALRSGLEHFADHCAMCHANDGSGNTEMGRGLYPKAPDMRLEATQSLTDGELYYIIENGVPLTGMPAWGTATPDGEAASWHLVQFIRHLPELTETELKEMEAMNPKSAEEWNQEQEIRRFLEGEGEAPKPAAPEHNHGGS